MWIHTKIWTFDIFRSFHAGDEELFRDVFLPEAYRNTSALPTSHRWIFIVIIIIGKYIHSKTKVHLSNCICRNSINIKCLPVLYLSRFTHSSPSLSCSLSFSFKSRALFVCSRLYTFRLVTLFHSSTTPKRLQYAGEVWIVERNLYENKCKPPQHKLDEWKYKGRGRWWRWVWEKAYFQLNKYSKNDKNGAVENYES